jgi:hypothetical protein
MRDDEWQAAYNAGRESVLGLVEALEDLITAVEWEAPAIADDVDVISRAHILMTCSARARTALEKYREGR